MGATMTNAINQRFSSNSGATAADVNLTNVFAAFAHALDQTLVDSRERALALTKLEESWHWALRSARQPVAE